MSHGVVYPLGNGDASAESANGCEYPLAAAVAVVILVGEFGNPIAAACAACMPGDTKNDAMGVQG